MDRTLTDSSEASLKALLNDPRETPVAKLEVAGVVICRVDPTQLHCGLIYRIDDQPPMIVHLGWHFVLFHEEPDESYLWAEFGDLDDWEKRLVAAQAKRIGDNGQDIPYAFTIGSARFDDSGHLIGLAAGDGLTCATFVVKVLADLGLEMVDGPTWPEHANDEWQARVVETLRNRTPKASQEHVDNVEAQEGARRITPAEVAGIGASEAWPRGFDDAAQLAAIITAEVDQFVASQAA